MQVRIKASKIDVFCKGATVYLGTTRTGLCTVAAILSYNIIIKLKPRKSQPTPFYCIQCWITPYQAEAGSGAPVSIDSSGNETRELRREQFPSWSCHNSSSMWNSRLPHQDTWEMGKCSYALYMYVRIPQSTLCAVSKKLVAVSQ